MGRCCRIISPTALLTDCSGAAAVEMAIVFPVFLTLCLGILAYGIHFGASHSVQQLAADAARYSISGLDNAERASLAQEYVTRNADEYPLIVGRRVQITSTPSDENANDLIVRVTYDASDLPIWRFVKFVSLPTPLIARVAVIHRGGQP